MQYLSNIATKVNNDSTLSHQCVQVWDMRVKRSIQTFTGKYQILAVAFSDAGDQVRLGSRCCAASSSAQPPGICEFKVTSHA